jgi:integrase
MLTSIAVRDAKPAKRQRKIHDARGLYLLIAPSGAKYWRLKYRFGGKERVLAIGVYDEVKLAEARDRRDEARRLLRDGIDPGAARRDQKRQAEHHAANTFKAVGEDWFAAKSAKWAPSTVKGTRGRLDELYSRLGSRPIAAIEPPEVLDALRAIERRGALEIARKTMVTAGQVFRFGIATGRAKSDPTRDLRGALQEREERHYSVLKREDLPEFLAKLAKYDGNTLTRLAIRFLALTFVRTGEMRGAKWTEFDAERAQWVIPAERMKMGEPHLVPLSRQALAVLEEIKRISGGREHVFPNEHHPLKPMSENTVLFALYRMGYRGRATGHGFRATASTILHEMGFRPDVIERQLAHVERNRVRRAYHRSQYITDRAAMMQSWGDLLDELAKPKTRVTPLRKRA